MRLWLGFLGFLLAVPALSAASALPPFRASGDMRASPDGREQIIDNHPEIESDDFYVTATEFRWRSDTRVLVASGDVAVTLLAPADTPGATRQQLRLIAARFEFHYATNTFEAVDIRLGAAPYFVSGPRALGAIGKEITVEDATVTWGEPGRWKPTLRAGRIYYAAGQKLRAEDVRIGVGSGFGVRIPKIEHGLDDPILGFFAFNAGYRSSLGAFVSAGLRLPVNNWMKAGGDAGFYWKRGIMIGPSADYGSTTDPDALTGKLESGYINDHGDKRTDVLGRAVPENRAFITLEHQQRLADGTRVAAEVNYWRDSEIVRDFRPGSFVNVQEPDTFFEAIRPGTNTVVSLFGRFEPNSFERVQQRLPELSVDLLPQPIGGGFVEEFHAAAAVLRENPPLTGATLREKRLDTYYQLRRPFAPSPWLSFTPVVGGRMTYYTDTVGATARTAGTFSRTFGEAGFDAELRAVGDFDYKNEVWKIDGLRHLVTPTLSYRYMPGADRDRGNIPLLDRNVFNTRLAPLDLAATRDIDQLEALNVVRFGLDNTIQTRDPDYGSRDLFRLNTAVDYRFQRQGAERDFSDIHFELTSQPAPWLRVDAYQSVSSRTFGLRQLSTAVTMHDGNIWSLRFANHFLRNDTEEYGADGTFLVSDAFETVARARYDARRHRLVERAVGLRQNIDNTWLVEYTATIYDGPRREGRWGLNVQIRSIGF